MDTYAGRPGDSIGFEAEGFAPREVVRVAMGSDPAIELGDFASNDLGEVIAQHLVVPDVQEGHHTVTLIGKASGRTAERQFSVIAFHPWVQLDSYAIRSGEGFGFSGSGFVPGESISIVKDGQGDAPLATVVADNEGNIRREVLLRAVPAEVGRHTLGFVGEKSGANLTSTYEVLAFVPVFELSSYAGPNGSTLSFTGRGFAPSERIHASVDMDGQQTELGAFSADQDGSFQVAGNFPAPADARVGDLAVRLIGEDSKVPVTQTFGILPLEPWGGLSAYSGPAGTELTVIGKGFGASEPVAIYIGTIEGAQPALTVTTDAQGDFQGGPLLVPNDATGILTITFVGQTTKGQATATFTVTGS